MVLVNLNKDVSKSDILGVAKSTTGALKAYNSAKITSSYSTGDYTWAAKYFLGYVGTIGTTYEIYFDQYDNMIGQAIPSAAYVYGILDSSIAVTAGWNPYVAAKLVNTAGEVNEITVAKYNGVNAFSNADMTSDRTVKYWHKLVSYSETANGYVLNDVNGIAADELKTTTPRIYKNGAVVAVADAETLYVVETAAPTPPTPVTLLSPTSRTLRSKSCSAPTAMLTSFTSTRSTLFTPTTPTSRSSALLPLISATA